MRMYTLRKCRDWSAKRQRTSSWMTNSEGLLNHQWHTNRLISCQKWFWPEQMGGIEIFRALHILRLFEYRHLSCQLPSLYCPKLEKNPRWIGTPVIESGSTNAEWFSCSLYFCEGGALEAPVCVKDLVDDIGKVAGFEVTWNSSWLTLTFIWYERTSIVFIIFLPNTTSFSTFYPYPS